MNRKLVQLSVAALLLSAPIAVHAQKDSGGKALPKLAAGSSYVACYFGNQSEHQWKWALTPANGWYSIAGNFNKSPFTKIQRFFTTATQSDIEAACAQSRAYYKITGSFFAAFAATQNLGANFPILSNGAYLFPQY
jgi:hypothetical protein